jgi:hypothetical protein
MNKTIGVQLVVYSLLLAGLSYLAYRLAPAIAQSTLVLGLIGGALGLVWGIRALGGARGKAASLLTLVPMSFFLLAQTVIGWSTDTTSVPGQGMAATLITALFVLSMGMIVRIAYAGVLFNERLDGQQSEPARPARTTSPPTPGAHPARRA